MKTIVIVPAAGLGTRMHAPGKDSPHAPKQFHEIGGAPILLHTLRKFVNHPRVDEIYLAMRQKESAAFLERLEQEKFKKQIRVVEGGDSRQETVSNALAEVIAGDDDVVLVHDAVRPFVAPESITGVIEAAVKHGAAIAGIPAIDTIKQVDRTAEGAIIVSTIPRERIVQVQTPQGFRLGVLRKAFADAAADGFTGTDEASLVERSGAEVWVVMGSARNIKITTPADLDLAELFLSQEQRLLTG